MIMIKKFSSTMRNEFSIYTGVYYYICCHHIRRNNPLQPYSGATISGAPISRKAAVRACVVIWQNCCRSNILHDRHHYCIINSVASSGVVLPHKCWRRLDGQRTVACSACSLDQNQSTQVGAHVLRMATVRTCWAFGSWRRVVARATRLSTTGIRGVALAACRSK